MVDGHRVLNADGTTREGGGAAAAQTWLTELTALIRSGDGYRLLYGDPDVAALVHNDGMTQLADAARIGALVPATASLPLVILPGNGDGGRGDGAGRGGARSGGDPALRRDHPDRRPTPRSWRVRTGRPWSATPPARPAADPAPPPATPRPRCSSGCCRTPGSPPAPRPRARRPVAYG